VRFPQASLPWRWFYGRKNSVHEKQNHSFFNEEKTKRKRPVEEAKFSPSINSEQSVLLKLNTMYSSAVGIFQDFIKTVSFFLVARSIYK